MHHKPSSIQAMVANFIGDKSYRYQPSSNMICAVRTPLSLNELMVSYSILVTKAPEDAALLLPESKLRII